MSAAIAAIKSHVIKSISGSGRHASHMQAMTLSELLTAHNPDSREHPILITKGLYRSLANELRADILQLKNSKPASILALPTINAWLDEGMGLAHSFTEGVMDTQSGFTGTPEPEERLVKSLLEEMWNYLPAPITEALPEGAVRGLLSFKGLIGEISKLGQSNCLSLGVLIGKSSPLILDMRNWSLWEEQDCKKTSKGTNRFRTRDVLPWLPVLSFAALGRAHYLASRNFVEYRSRLSASKTPLKLIVTNLRGICDLELLDQYVTQTHESWSSHHINETLKGVIDTNFFWSTRNNQISDEIKDFWLSKAQLSLAGSPEHAAWTVNLLGSLYASNLPETMPTTLDARFRHLDMMLKKFPEVLSIYEYLNEHQYLAQASAEGDSQNQIWADEAFLSPLDDISREKWLDALSQELSEEMLNDYKHGRTSAALYERSQINWFFRARHPRLHQLLGDKLLGAISIGTMEKKYPRAGSSLLEVAVYDLQRPERRSDAVALINGTRSSKWKIFLVNHLGIPAGEVKLSPKQRDSVFSYDLGL